MAEAEECPVLCDACLEGDDIAQAESAIYRCRICRNRALCENHSHRHTKAKGASHTMMDLNEGVCTTHRGSPLVAFCTNENLPLCEECLPAHRNHSIATLDEAAVAQRALLEEDVSALRERVAALEHARADAERLAALARERQNAAVNDIRMSIEPLIETLTRLMEELMCQAQATFAPALTVLEELEARCTRAQQTLQQAESVRNATDAAVTALAQVHAAVEQALSLNVAEKVFVPLLKLEVAPNAAENICSQVQLVQGSALCLDRCVLHAGLNGEVRAALVDVRGQPVSLVDPRDIGVELEGAVDAKCGWELQKHELVVTVVGLRRGDASLLHVTWRGQHLAGSPLAMSAKNWAFGSQGSGPGQFLHPRGVCVSGRELFVADSGNHRVSVLSLDGEFLRQFGSYGSGDGRLNNPYGLAVCSGEVFVCDYNNHRVMVFTVSGAYNRKWGSQGDKDGQFLFPCGIAVREEDVFVVDEGNPRVCVFSREGVFRKKWDSYGQPRQSFSRGNWKDVSVVGQILYVCDYKNKRVVAFSLRGELVARWECPSNPSGVCGVQGSVWISLYDIHQVIQYDSQGRECMQLGSFQGAGLGQLSFPHGLCASDDILFVADCYNHRIQGFTTSG